MAIIISGGTAGAGSSDWSTLTGKPPIQTAVGNPGSDSNLASEQAVREAIKPTAIAFYYPEPANGELVLVDAFPSFTGTITKLSVKTASGTVNVTVKINGTAVTGLSAVAASSVRATATGTAANTVTEDDVLSIEFAGGATPVDVTGTIWIDRVG